jgi:hypothetical protein
VADADEAIGQDVEQEAAKELHGIEGHHLLAVVGVQETLVRAEPKHFYRPPYVGPAGWVGVRLDTGLD